MSSWLALSSYHPLAILAAGLLTFLGVLEAGEVACRNRLSPKLPVAWRVVASALLGIQLLSAGVQALGIAGVAWRWALLGWLALFWMGGILRSVRWLGTHRGMREWNRLRHWNGIALAALALLGLTIATNLVIALSPSTKADEIFYHMLVPARVVHDNALRFYLFPLLAASLPQLAYQLAGAPLHAASLPDAMNVVSWAFSAMLAWFSYRLLREAGHTSAWSTFWCAAMMVGLHAAVWHVTGGSHAMGELALAALLIAVVAPESMRSASACDRALVIGICASAAATSKISTLPVAGVLLAVGLVYLVRGASRHEASRIVLRGVIPGALLYLPLVAFTWHESGAPLGPLLSWWFPGSRYETLNVQALLIRERYALLELATRHSPALWVGVVGAVLSSSLTPRRRVLVGAVLCGQALLIALQLPHDPRFLGGLTFGAMLLFAMYPAPWVMRAPTVRSAAWTALLTLLVPWCALSIYYARPFAAVVGGVTPVEEFRDRYIAFYRDFGALDRILPPNAVLYVTEKFARPSVYAPRPLAWWSGDIPSGVPVYQFAFRCELMDSSYVAREVVYLNPLAHGVTYRKPGRPPRSLPLCVRRLDRKMREVR